MRAYTVTEYIQYEDDTVCKYSKLDFNKNLSIKILFSIDVLLLILVNKYVPIIKISFYVSFHNFYIASEIKGLLILVLRTKTEFISVLYFLQTKELIAQFIINKLILC